MDQFVLLLLSVNGFHIQDHWHIDLQASLLKNNRGLLLNEKKHPMKFEGYKSHGSLDIEHKWFSHPRPY